MGLTIALAGNPNSGKTTLFNELTGSNQYVGNWPGVTVERKTGRAKKQKDVTITDLPGIYSLSTYTLEEVISREYIESGEPGLIINIVDASNLERNLFLTLQLIEMGKPMVVALNMMDILSSRGVELDIKRLSAELGIPIIPITASKGLGIDVLMEAALNQQNIAPKQLKIYDSKVNRVISMLEEQMGVEPCSRMHAIRFVEEGQAAVAGHSIDVVLAAKLNEQIDRDLAYLDLDRDMIISDQKYRFITDLVAVCTVKGSRSPTSTRTIKLDKVLTNRILAIPAFLGVMFFIFWVAFGPIGSQLAEWFESLIGLGADALSNALKSGGEGFNWLHSLVMDGIVGGVGAVLGFLPQIAVLFLMLSILEDTGYMARAAFIMDRPLRRFGLSGKSFIPMLMGFGCTVPALMACRTLENQKDRRLTMMITPFMSCGARLPIYGVFAGAFFPEYETIAVFSMYLLGIVVALLSGLILKRFVTKSQVSGFLLELPEYRLPTLRNLSMHVWERVKGFVIKAGTIVLLASVVIWLMQTFSFSFAAVDNPQDSMLGQIGQFIAPIFAPMGFNWQASVSLLTGFVAKEAVVGTMGILYHTGEEVADVAAAIAASGTFTAVSALAFMVFSLLYMPCVAAFATLKREIRTWGWTLGTVAYQTGVAWIVAFIVFQIGGLFF